MRNNYNWRVHTVEMQTNTEPKHCEYVHSANIAQHLMSTNNVPI